MRISVVAFYTLAALIVCDTTYQASASVTSDFPETEAGSPVAVALNSPTDPDLAVIATDVQVIGANEELQQIVRNAIQTRTGGETSQTQLQKDVASILATGLFANARANRIENAQGWSVVYEVEPVVMRSLQLQGAQVLTLPVVNDIFKAQLGAPINPTTLKQSAQQINQWYAQNGYDLAQVVALQPNREGVLNVEVAEGLVGDIKIRFVNQDGKLEDDKGQPIKGRTQEDFIKRELKLKPGEIFRRDVAQKDLQSLYRTGLFEKADISLNGDARRVDVIYNLTELPARAVNVGAGYNTNAGLVGTVSYQDNNVGGVNQRLSANVQGNSRDIQFNAKFADPYRDSQPNRWGYSMNVFRERVLSLTFNEDVKLANGDSAREGQFGGGLTLTHPIGEWQGSVGVNYQRTSIRDREGNLAPVDELGNSLTYSDTGIDDLTTVSAAVTRDRRDNPFNPTSGSVLSLSTEQSIPIGQGNIVMNRLQANYSQYVPLNLMHKDDPEVLALNVQAGTTIGNLPPYEAFNLGGPNSVRGYGAGEVGTGRSYVLASAEYRFPIFKPVGGVVFADFASDLGSGDTVPGEPGVVRGKPGIGFGYGAGLRFNSPIGVIRTDYGINDRGESRLQFGIGQRF